MLDRDRLSRVAGVGVDESRPHGHRSRRRRTGRPKGEHGEHERLSKRLSDFAIVPSALHRPSTASHTGSRDYMAADRSLREAKNQPLRPTSLASRIPSGLK